MSDRYYKGNRIITSKEKYGHETSKYPRMDFERTHGYLHDLKEVFNNIGIRFGLFYGTLIGAIRDKDFCFHDDDSDVCILYEDAHKIKEAEKKFKELGYYLCLSNMTNGKYNFGYIAKREHREKVDIYTLTFFQGARCWYHHQEKGKALYIPYPKEHFDSFDKIIFRGEEFTVPHKPEELLDYMWGDWWNPCGKNLGIIPAKKINFNEYVHNERNG